MPFLTICRRCNHYIFTATRQCASESLINHFLRSHKRLPRPDPREREDGKVKHKLPIISDDYYAFVITTAEFSAYQFLSQNRPAEFFSAINSKL